MKRLDEKIIAEETARQGRYETRPKAAVPGRHGYGDSEQHQRSHRPDVKDLPSEGAIERITRDQLTGTTEMLFGNSASWTIGKVRYDYQERQRYQTNGADPSRSRFLGEEFHRIRPPGRDLRLETTIDIQSDSTAFHVSITRVLKSGGKQIRRKVWNEMIPRLWH